VKSLKLRVNTLPGSCDVDDAAIFTPDTGQNIADDAVSAPAFFSPPVFGCFGCCAADAVAFAEAGGVDQKLVNHPALEPEADSDAPALEPAVLCAIPEPTAASACCGAAHF